MDDPLKDLETELAALRPVRPGRRLEQRLAAELEPRRRLNWAWLALPMAAAFAVVFAWQTRGVRPMPESAPFETPAETSAQPTPAFKPVATQNLLYAARDEGVVMLEDGRKVRRTSRSYVDTVVWRDPGSNASVTWSVPREEVRLTPVSFQ
ncbi:MAG: hypothetical protein H7A44_12350 [Opitutaceae bacterium]|nr:hypothetical protein [Cephaloticoccus sp.]MCP5531215.1 hypothetical protein [Opitutaceae bacterium]